MRRAVLPFLSALALGWCASASAGAATPVVTEFSAGLTAGSAPQGIALGPDGNMWFTDFGTSRIGRITPQGVITEFPLIAGAQPFDITAGHDGAMWFTEFGRDRLGRITMAGVATEPVTLPAGAQPIGITADTNGNIWAAQQGLNALVRFNPANPVSGTNPSQRTLGITAPPRGIAAGPDFAVHFTETANNFGRHGIMSTGSVESPGVASEGIAFGPDGSRWTVSPLNNTFLRDGSANTLFPTPMSFPQDVAAGPDGAMWMTEINANKIARAGTADGFQEFSTGITAGSQPFGIAAGADGAMWFTEAAGRIGRITTPDDPFPFTSAAPINAFSPSTGAATPYPATLDVSGLQGIVTRVRVRLNGAFLKQPFGFGALLVDPGGRAVLLARGNGSNSDANGAVLTFADDGRDLNQLVSGRYSPTDGGFSGSLPAPAPAAPYSRSLSTFNGADPNGTWRLYVAETLGVDPSDTIAGGWSLDIETAPPQTIQVPVPGPTQTVTVPGPTQTIIVPAPRDIRRASVRLSKIASTTTLAKLLKGISLTVTPDEAVSLSVSLIGTQKKATLAAVRVALFEKAFGLSSGPRAVKLKPSKSALGTPRKAFKLTLRVDATDRGGNRTRVDRPLRVTLPKKKSKRR